MGNHQREIIFQPGFRVVMHTRVLSDSKIKVRKRQNRIENRRNHAKIYNRTVSNCFSKDGLSRLCSRHGKICRQNTRRTSSPNTFQPIEYEMNMHSILFLLFFLFTFCKSFFNIFFSDVHSILACFIK